MQVESLCLFLYEQFQIEPMIGSLFDIDVSPNPLHHELRGQFFWCEYLWKTSEHTAWLPYEKRYFKRIQKSVWRMTNRQLLCYFLLALVGFIRRLLVVLFLIGIGRIHSETVGHHKGWRAYSICREIDGESCWSKFSFRRIGHCWSKTEFIACKQQYMWVCVCV